MDWLCALRGQDIPSLQQCDRLTKQVQCETDRFVCVGPSSFFNVTSCSVSSESGLLSDGMKSAAIWGRILSQQYPVPAIVNDALCQNCYLPLLLFLLFFSLFRISWSRVGLDPHQTQPWCWTLHGNIVVLWIPAAPSLLCTSSQWQTRNHEKQIVLLRI